jgi:hypothetical protein
MKEESAKLGVGTKLRDSKMAFYHPNGTGTGVALQFEPRINRNMGDRYNCFFFEMAGQKTISGREGDKRVMATFDWSNKLTVKMDFSDLCEMLLVLEGRQERVGGQKNGIYHDSDKANTVISFAKIPEKGGYAFGLSRKDKESGQLNRLNIVLSEAESIGLRCLIQSGLFFITFHSNVFAVTDRTESGESRILD